MSGDWDEDMCKKAMVLVEELCFNSPRGYSQSERCQEFSYLLRGRNRQLDTGEAPPRPQVPIPHPQRQTLVNEGRYCMFREASGEILMPKK